MSPTEGDKDQGCIEVFIKVFRATKNLANNM